MKRKTYVVYATDAWHSRSSCELIGVCTSLTNIMKVIRADISEFKYKKLDEDDKRSLMEICQTQGRDRNYMYMEVDKNILL